MATRKNFRDRIKRRKEQATERQEARNKYGDNAQLNKLTQAGHTMCREWRRLFTKLYKESKEV